MPKGAYLLYEAAAGYSLFEVIEAEEIGAKVPEVEEAINDLKLFSKFVKYVSFVPFKDAQDALSNINDISEGIVNDTLKDFLELNLPKVKEGKKAKFWVGVSDAKLGNSINEGLGFPCKCEEITKELLRISSILLFSGDVFVSSKLAACLDLSKDFNVYLVP